MDKMFEAIQAEVTEDPPTMEVEAFFKLLNASKEPLHEHTKVTFLAFITRLVAIMSKYFFSNNCYNDLLKLINDIEGPEKATRGGGWMGANQNSLQKLGLYPKIDLKTLPSNSAKTAKL
jgi:hypothetical protein